VLTAYFDGCCEPRNPGGHAAWGAVMFRGDDRIWEDKGYCGVGPTISNNVAEYSGVAAVLYRLQREKDKCLIYGDSKLVIMQLSKKWKIRGGLYVPFYQKAKGLYEPIADRVSFKWIPREENSVCDVLSKTVLKELGVRFRIQPETEDRV